MPLQRQPVNNCDQEKPYHPKPRPNIAVLPTGLDVAQQLVHPQRVRKSREHVEHKHSGDLEVICTQHAQYSPEQVALCLLAAGEWVQGRVAFRDEGFGLVVRCERGQLCGREVWDTVCETNERIKEGKSQQGEGRSRLF